MKRSIIPLLLITIVYFGARAPYFSQVLVGEEGLFAKVFYDHPRGPNYILAGRIDGQEYYDPLQHPGVMCEMLGMLGRMPCYLENCRTMSEVAATTTVRSIFSLFQFPIWVLLVALVGRECTSNKFLLYAVLIAVIVSPLAVSSSLTIHLDGTFGALMCGLMALAFLNRGLSMDVPQQDTAWIGILLAGLWLGLGKNPWTISLMAALVFCLIWLSAFTQLNGNARRDLFCALLGCLVGNVCSYLIDPVNYTMGWNLLLRLSGTHIVVGSDVTTFGQLTLKRLPFLVTNIVLMGLLGVLIVQKGIRKMPYWLVFNLAFAGALFFSFFLSTWNDEPRYFAPSLVVMAITVMGLLAQTEHPIKPWAAVAIFVPLLIQTGAFFVIAHMKNRSVTMYPGIAHVSGDRKSWRILIPPDRHCVPRLDTAVAYRDKSVDFIGSSVGIDYARQLVSKHGKVVCDR